MENQWNMVKLKNIMSNMKSYCLFVMRFDKVCGIELKGEGIYLNEKDNQWVEYKMIREANDEQFVQALGNAIYQ